MATTSIPSVRDLIAEYAAIEDRMRAIEARVFGGSAEPLDPELVRLTERERQVLAMLRRHHRVQSHPPSVGHPEGVTT